MKTFRMIALFMGLIPIIGSCSLFSNNKSSGTQSSAYESDGTSKIQSRETVSRKQYSNELFRLRSRANQARIYIREKGFSTRYCFLVDMRLHSGKKRFFVYDLVKNSVSFSGLVSHGSCKEGFLSEAKFSNTPKAGCSSMGKYKIGKSYHGQFGKSYKMHGLENTNSNAYSRAIVLHSFSCVPDEEIYPKVICNSLGCAGVSPSFFKKISVLIDRSDKPILLWIYK